ncbi:hypothetical protein [Flavobacterium sp. 3HN19-14]|uniref:hypothetical protein n=1 Tax=Flavobacterium sp. 3HN19-14 TaxID=3448133 RepID=UPI003EE0C477
MKFFAFGILLLVLISCIVYSQLTNRHKAIIKTTFLYKTGLVDSEWNVTDTFGKYAMVSPTFLIDGIYKSMEGPKSSNYVQLSKDSTLLWMTGFNVEALDAKTGEKLSNDFICHTNIDFNDVKYYSNFNLNARIGSQYPRLTSLSNGMENFEFPKGFGVPMRGNDLLFVTTESLNHNIKDITKWIKHEVTISYSSQTEKPLMSRTVFIMLPFDKEDPYKDPLDPGSNSCIPVETKNHTYEDGKGNKLSGHWVIPVGKNTYRSSANGQLQIKDSLRLHAAAIHVHPFATAIRLFDKTANKAVFTSNIKNYTTKIGLESVPQFSSEKGIWLYGNHDYELILDVNNTTNENQDMMGSMFLFFYDAELDAKLNH